MPRIEYTALHTRVLAVAVEGGIKDWAVYIGPVPGMRHSDEYREVMNSGCKCSEALAKCLFPGWTDLDYRG